VFGAELRGEARVRDAGGRERRIGFRADRADLAGGRLRLTDYKTGKPVAANKTPKGRRKELERKMARGEWLQAAVYLAGARELTNDTMEGRYLFLRDGVADDARVAAVGPADRDLLERFEAASRVLFAALDQGALFPRLVDADAQEPRACEWCELALACLRGESGHRARLLRVGRRAARAEREAEPMERAAADLYWLGRDAPKDDEGAP
jgi:hypothetical protein